MRKFKFVNGEIYHVYNRGVDKRSIFLEPSESRRFLECLIHFNSVDPIESLYVHALRSPDEKAKLNSKKIVELIAYCLNPNHFHLVIKQLKEGGISEFMKRLGGGYTNFFNERHKRSGSLFQGTFKAKHIQSNDHLLHLSAYVNLNDRVHKIKSPVVRTSYNEYRNYKASNQELCKPSIILDQFKNIPEYLSFADNALDLMLEHKETVYDLNALTLE